MTVRLERGRSVPGHFPVVSIPPKHVAFCVMTCAGREIGGRYVHWLPKERESAPCHGDGRCKWCLTMARHYCWFAPVFWWYHEGLHKIGASIVADPHTGKRSATGRWKKAVLRVTEHMKDLVLHDLSNKVIQVTRRGEYKNAPLTWRTIEPFPEDLRESFGTFDVEDSVNLLWGVWAKLGMLDEENEDDASPGRHPQPRPAAERLPIDEPPQTEEPTFRELLDKLEERQANGRKRADKGGAL